MAMIRAAAAVALLVVLATAMQGVQAECPAATSFLSCQKAITTKDTMPSEACCAKVQQTLQGPDGARCLCEAMTSPTAEAFKVIESEAALLPSKCEKLMGLQYIKNYNCAGTIVP